MNQLDKLAVTVDYRYSTRVAMYGEVSANIFISQKTDGSQFAPSSFYDNDAHDVDSDGNYEDTSVNLWPSFHVGLEF